MSVPRTLEDEQLQAAKAALGSLLADVAEPDRAERHLQTLEAVAGMIGGFDAEWYWASSPWAPAHGTIDGRAVSTTVEAIRQSGIHPSLALASLARVEVPFSTRRKTGAYYTDFRIAQYVGAATGRHLSAKSRIVDPAAGTGILLVATLLGASEAEVATMSSLVGDAVCAADLSELALRGTALAIASLTADQGAIRAMLDRLQRVDSLSRGRELLERYAPDGFDAIVSNPPWEKLKVSRHDYLTERGVARHYGADYDADASLDGLDSVRRGLKSYMRGLGDQFTMQGEGELDYYMLFVELALRLARRGGRLGLVVPAGVIRSKGTARLRQHLIDASRELEITVFENRARFFAIDTRFKFLTVRAAVDAGRPADALRLTHAHGVSRAVELSGSVDIPRDLLTETRPDLSIPEVRSAKEWQLFLRLSRGRARFGDDDGVWAPALLREVDMTTDKQRFLPAGQGLPLFEGRMIHQFWHGAKGYVCGTGRAARWAPFDPTEPCQIAPQFSYPPDALSPGVLRRAQQGRVGFCDITGQTNERTILAARIPPNVVCGNKVPTILFHGSSGVPRVQMGDCWLAIANSFVFDWIARRVMTTTVNFFLLLTMPMPDIAPGGVSGDRLAALAADLSQCEHFAEERLCQGVGVRDQWERAERRAEIDWQVLAAYGLDAADLDLILADFPLLDRAYKPLPGEKRSTITRDFLFLRAKQALGGTQDELDRLSERVERARALGAIPYQSSHLAAARDG